jgi:hypothetical protein
MTLLFTTGTANTTKNESSTTLPRETVNVFPSEMPPISPLMVHDPHDVAAVGDSVGLMVGDCDGNSVANTMFDTAKVSSARTE